MKSFTQKTGEIQEFLDLIENDCENIRRVKNVVEGLSVDFEVHPKAESVNESVEHSKVSKDRIIKTLVFKAGKDFVAVMCPGDKRVDEQKLEELTDNSVRMAAPEEVEKTTGYVVGGVSPFDLDIPIYAADSIPNGEVRPAAGSRVVGLKIDKDALMSLVDAKIEKLTK